MTDLQEKAMRLALERLESHEYWMDERAIQALRTALAQPNREWVGLTDEELRQAYCEVSGKEWCLGGMSNAHTFYEAIEAKLKEKNT
jgi:hypothetical protein